MTDFNTEDKPQIQIPIRVNHSLYKKFNHISNHSHVPKSVIARLALKSFLEDIEHRGITTVLQECEA